MDNNSNPPVEPIGSTPPAAPPPESTPTPPNISLPTPEPPQPIYPAKKSKKLLVILLSVILVVLLASGAAAYFLLANKSDPTPNPTPAPVESVKLKETAGITVTPTTLDEITADSVWCGTFQLVWNDMKNDIVGGDIVFDDGNPAAVDNLNKETFKSDMLSSDYYYKTYGLKTPELKSKIEQGIKDKFNETSDVLDNLDWSENGVNDPNNPDVKRYLFYAMLKRNFEYQYELNKLDNQKFGDQDDVAFFGTKGVKSEAYKQFEVLYYNSKDDFAIQINTKDREEVIFVSSPEGNTFNSIYEKMNAKKAAYKGSSRFQVSDDYIDDFKAPNLAMNEKKEYKELYDHKFPIINSPDGRDWEGEILAAIQTIQFKIDEKGGEIKSEAVIDMGMDATSVSEEPSAPEHRYFYLDDTFAMFLREKGKSQPYFAIRVDDITKYQ
jgi:hypothetical protein